MLGSIIASYAAIVINGGKSTSSTGESQVDEAKIAEYEADYNAKLAEFQSFTKIDYEKLMGFKKEIKAFNETSANASGVQHRDLKEGSGRELGESASDYLAYYIGYCADESVFDSSFDDNDNPTGFKAEGLLDLSQMSLIEGWYIGMKGAKLDGVREITIPSELAYGEVDKACGANKPLKFIVLAKERDDKLLEISDALSESYLRLQYAIYYGVDYDTMMDK